MILDRTKHQGYEVKTWKHFELELRGIRVTTTRLSGNRDTILNVRIGKEEVGLRNDADIDALLAMLSDAKERWARLRSERATKP